MDSGKISEHANPPEPGTNPREPGTNPREPGANPRQPGAAERPGAAGTRGEGASSSEYLAREIDAAAMKAFAHPLRMAMYERLGSHGPATATMLAQFTGESTGQTSYHLRQLARHGFVEEETGRGSGRERWWKAVGFSVRAALMRNDASVRPAVDSMLHALHAQRTAELSTWLGRAGQAEELGTEEARWVNSSTNSRSTATMTVAEMDQLRHEAMQLIHEHTERAKERHRSDGEETRRVRIYLDIFPLPED